jgi:hypothetical protein
MPTHLSPGRADITTSAHTQVNRDSQLDDLLRRVRAEYLEMPGLHLSAVQAPASVEPGCRDLFDGARSAPRRPFSGTHVDRKLSAVRFGLVSCNSSHRPPQPPGAAAVSPLVESYQKSG